MVICIDGEACHPSVDLKGPDSLPTWHRKHSAAVGGVQSDLTTQTFSVLLHPSSRSDCPFLIFLIQNNCFVFIVPSLFLLSLQWFVSRSSFVFILGLSSGLMSNELNQDPWSNLLFTLSTALPTPLLYCFALLSSSSSFLFLFFFFTPPTISHFSWTPSMWYSVYRHRYGWLSLHTVSALIPFRPLLVSSMRSSHSTQQVGSLLLCGLHLLNVQYKPTINVFALFPSGNKAV